MLNVKMLKMKKIIFMMVAMIGFAMNAQTYTEPSIFDNTYASLRYGVTSMMHPKNFDKNWSHNLAGQTTLQLGKWITPRTGFALEGTVSWNTFSCKKWGDNIVPFMTVSALGKYRLIDDGRWAFTLAAGPGWMHSFKPGDGDKNNLMAKAEIELNYRINDRLTLDIVPELAYNLTPKGSEGTQEMGVSVNGHYAWYGLNVGVTYRLGGKFKECPYTYTQGEVDHLNAMINDLRAELEKKPKQVVTEKEIIKTVEVVKPVQGVYTVMFAKNSAELTTEAKAMLDEVAGSVEIVATASPEGSERRNNELSQERANVVKDYLANRGVKVIAASGVGVDGPASNRVATVIVK